MLTEVVAHEVGHTLGLRHNFKSSTWLGMDGLGKAGETAQQGLVGSVMDYTAINIAAPGQPQGEYFASAVGPARPLGDRVRLHRVRQQREGGAREHRQPLDAARPRLRHRRGLVHRRPLCRDLGPGLRPGRLRGRAGESGRGGLPEVGREGRREGRRLRPVQPLLRDDGQPLQPQLPRPRPLPVGRADESRRGRPGERPPAAGAGRSRNAAPGARPAAQQGPDLARRHPRQPAAAAGQQEGRLLRLVVRFLELRSAAARGEQLALRGAGLAARPRPARTDWPRRPSCAARTRSPPSS